MGQCCIETDVIAEVFNGNVSCSGQIPIVGPLINQYWRLINESDDLILYNNAENACFNFAANIIYAA